MAGDGEAVADAHLYFCSPPGELYSRLPVACILTRCWLGALAVQSSALFLFRIPPLATLPYRSTSFLFLCFPTQTVLHKRINAECDAYAHRERAVRVASAFSEAARCSVALLCEKFLQFG